MTKAHENRFKRALEAKRDEVNQEICELRERLAINSAGDPVDQVRSIVDRELLLCRVDRTCAELRLVEGALREICEGTFGICASCGRDIPARRLAIVPWSPYCVACQERAEQSEGSERLAEYQPPYALAS